MTQNNICTPLYDPVNIRENKFIHFGGLVSTSSTSRCFYRLALQLSSLASYSLYSWPIMIICIHTIDSFHNIIEAGALCASYMLYVSLLQ